MARKARSPSGGGASRASYHSGLAFTNPGGLQAVYDASRCRRRHRHEFYDI
jgi:hypothetical protein